MDARTSPSPVHTQLPLPHDSHTLTHLTLQHPPYLCTTRTSYTPGTPTCTTHTETPNPQAWRTVHSLPHTVHIMHTSLYTIPLCTLPCSSHTHVRTLASLSWVHPIAEGPRVGTLVAVSDRNPLRQGKGTDNNNPSLSTACGPSYARSHLFSQQLCWAGAHTLVFIDGKQAWRG